MSVAAHPLSDSRSWMRVELAEVVPQPTSDPSLDAACDPMSLALEHGVNTNLLFKWRRDYRARKFGVPDPAHLLEQPAGIALAATSESETAVTLLPVQVTPAGQFWPFAPVDRLRLNGSSSVSRVASQFD